LLFRRFRIPSQVLIVPILALSVVILGEVSAAAVFTGRGGLSFTGRRYKTPPHREWEVLITSEKLPPHRRWEARGIPAPNV
jgi:hypothetical protein